MRRSYGFIIEGVVAEEVYRCGRDPAARSGGVRKVDFLMRECIFLGLSKGREGMYEMRTRKI